MKRSDVIELQQEDNRELDLLVAKYIMADQGFVEDPDDWSDREEVWYWVHPRSGILIGFPYYVNTFREDPEPMMYDHSWKNFKPSSDLEHAFMVFEKVGGLGDFLPYILKNKDGTYEVSFNGLHYVKNEPSLPAAICVAALLTLVED